MCGACSAGWGPVCAAAAAAAGLGESGGGEIGGAQHAPRDCFARALAHSGLDAEEAAQAWLLLGRHGGGADHSAKECFLQALSAAQHRGADGSGEDDVDGEELEVPRPPRPRLRPFPPTCAPTPCRSHEAEPPSLKTRSTSRHCGQAARSAASSSRSALRKSAMRSLLGADFARGGRWRASISEASSALVHAS